jgi:hypothetical protein
VSQEGRKIGGSVDGPVDAAEILAALANDSSADDRRRRAVRRCLSASEGWREASAELRGAFAQTGGMVKAGEGRVSVKLTSGLENIFNGSLLSRDIGN